MMDTEKIKGAAQGIKMSDEDKKRITENAVRSAGSSKRSSRGLIIGAGAAAAVCIVTASAFAVTGGFGTGSIPMESERTPVDTLTGIYSVPDTKAEGYEGAANNVTLENSGAGFETSTADEEENKPGESDEQESRAVDHETPPEDKAPVNQGDWIPTKWNGIYCDPGLYKELSVWNGTEQAFSVAAELVKFDETELRSYVYNGKSVDDYLKDTEYYSSCLDDLQNILQYVLGNGTPLYVVEAIDEEFRAQYITDGEYDIDKINNDIGKYQGQVKDSSFAYDEAYSAFRDEKLSLVIDELKKAGINAELKEDGLLHFIAGGEQLSKISLADSENYCFLMETDNTDDDIFERGEDQGTAEDEEQIFYKGC